MTLVFLDAGHGGRDSGAVANGLREKDIALKVALRVGDILTNDFDGAKVQFTRRTDVFHSLSKRAAMANRANADFFVSFHVNAGGGTGYEDFVHTNVSKNGSTERKRSKMHSRIVPVLEKYGLRNRGKKKMNLAVLRESHMSAVLVETLFIDTKSDADLLNSASFLEDISQAYAQGIASAVGAVKKPKKVAADKPSKPNDTLHKVQVGAYASKENAKKLEARLKKEGFDTFIVTE